MNRPSHSLSRRERVRVRVSFYGSWPVSGSERNRGLPMNRWNFLGRATSPRAPRFRIGALGDRALPNPSRFMVRVQF